MSTPDKPPILQWLFDTRPWFPSCTTPSQLPSDPLASRILALLTPSEATAVLKYYHVRDAKMSLASSLLKHLAIAHLSPTTPWTSTLITRDPLTKPTWIDPATGRAPIAFNVTHQAGLVALIAIPSLDPSLEKIQVGIDLVCTSERRTRDHALIATDTWPRFVDMHADVFSPRETSYLKYEVLSRVPGLVPPGATAEQVTDAKLRAFYALWALREAYVKLTGEALLAEWLKELEFRAFRPVAPTSGWGVPAREEDGTRGEDGRYGAQVIGNPEVWFRGKRVEDVNMSLRALGEDYMICTAVRTPGRREVGMGWKLRGYRVLELEEMLEFAEARAAEAEGKWLVC
ncbi:hypothetical protein QBC34DRAFT_128845 [Podospora aff. communis PSN243]|uniref:holo-[acyl-carrier-protein] synthase n=1 Tax=Podospora aff. communis PSN243 TaxID=3040156 RepID=A0AAV9GH06_9PEZI|nr:hypothetical protein QBC34DRAFT_128845 [Podospora aff. communis PSN243]